MTSEASKQKGECEIQRWIPFGEWVMVNVHSFIHSFIHLSIPSLIPSSLEGTLTFWFGTLA